MLKSLPVFLCCIFMSCLAFAQGDTGDPLYSLLLSKDSMVFERGYNNVDLESLSKVVSEDLEMYHDQQGALYEKDQLIQGIASLANMPFKSRRELVKGSVEVYPLYNREGKLYAAIQNGEHRFLAKEKDKPEYVTSTAKFTSVWFLEEDGEWRLRRALSYDHQAPKN